ncbi:hypothetical protein EXO78_06295 [Salmonella enterica]|nr:hypothetical protein [Salmonella enterica]
MKKLILIAVILLAACTDADRAHFTALGKPHHVTVYQFNNVIYDGMSTGRITSSDHKVSFEDAKTHELVEIILGQSSTVVSKVQQ